MNTLLRLGFVVVLSGSFCFGQSASSEVPAGATISTPGGVLLASNASAIEPIASVPASGTMLVQPAVVAKAPSKPEISLRQRGVFYGLMGAEHGAALLDAWSTREVLRQGGRELDPLVRPFAHSLSLYPALQVAPFAVDYFALRLMHSNHRLLRNMWWVPQLVATAGSAYCGASNLGQRR